jgi:hypothetical protein
MEQTPTTPVSPSPSRWPFFVIGFLFFLLGPAINFAQISMGKLVTPWHVPVLATVGLAFMGLSVVQRGGIVRPIAFLLFLTVCGFEWFFIVHMIRVPEYTGPAQPGEALPAFAARKADGTTFSHTDLAVGVPSIMLFYRGRW